jgi:hypothetical protein
VEANHMWVPQAAVGQQFTLKLCVCCQSPRQLLDCNQVLTDSILGKDDVPKSAPS